MSFSWGSQGNALRSQVAVLSFGWMVGNSEVGTWTCSRHFGHMGRTEQLREAGFFVQVEPTAFVNTSRLPVANQFSMSALLILCHLTILGRAGEFRIFRTENGEHSLMPTVPRKMWVHYKTCSTSPVVAARCHTGSPLSALDMRLLRTQNSSRRTRAFAVVGHRPKSKEH